MISNLYRLSSSTTNTTTYCQIIRPIIQNQLRRQVTRQGQRHYHHHHHHRNHHHRQQQQSIKRHNSNSTPPPPPPNTDELTTTSLSHLLLTITIRLLSAVSIVSLTSEYGIELTRCEGPSMTPTILSTGGEIIVIERWSARWYGLEGGPLDGEEGDAEDEVGEGGGGGDVGTVRMERNRRRQVRWEAKQKAQQKAQQQANTKPTKTTPKNNPPTHPNNNNNDIPTWHKPIPTPISSPTFQNKTYKQTITTNFNRILRSGVTVGDVVVLQHPERDGTICKRILGLPGDMVLRPAGAGGSKRGGRSGRGRNEEEEMRRRRKEWFGFHHQDHNRSDEYNSLQSLFQDDDDNDIISPSSLTTSSLLTIPDGHVWVEGDNSLNSADSRHYGPVPAALIVGKVFFRIWPIRGDSMSVMRGGRPLPSTTLGGRREFTGSVVLPAGYEGERLVGSSSNSSS